MKSTNEQTRRRRLRLRKDPESVSLSQAAHWIVTGEQPVSPEDERAIGRKFDSNSREFREATADLILALRQGHLHAKGIAQLTPGDITSDDAGRFPRTAPWRKFLARYKKQLVHPRPSGPHLITIEPIPEGFWDTLFLDWEQMSLSYELGPIDCDIFRITLPFEDLKRAFGTEPIKWDADQCDDPNRLSVKEQHSLMKLFAGIAATKYGYRPQRQRTNSTAMIINDLDSVGIPVSKDTVRKFLTKTAQYPDYSRLGDD